MCNQSDPNMRRRMCSSSVFAETRSLSHCSFCRSSNRYPTPRSPLTTRFECTQTDIDDSSRVKIWGQRCDCPLILILYGILQKKLFSLQSKTEKHRRNQGLLCACMMMTSTWRLHHNKTSWLGVLWAHELHSQNRVCTQSLEQPSVKIVNTSPSKKIIKHVVRMHLSCECACTCILRMT